MIEIIWDCRGEKQMKNNIYPNTKLVFFAEGEENHFTLLGDLDDLKLYLEENLGTIQDDLGPIENIKVRLLTKEQIKALSENGDV